MASDNALRAALAARVEALDPRVEAELEAVLRRAQRRTWARRSAYTVGVLAAAAVVVAVVVSQQWLTSGDPQPVEDVEVPGRTLEPNRGTWDDAEALDEGRWLVDFEDASLEAPDLLVDVPAGWSQDDDMVLTTGAGAAPSTLRIELNAHNGGIWPNPCSPREATVRGAATLAAALADMKWLGTGPAEPVELDGHQGWFVRLAQPEGLDPKDCRAGALQLWERGRYMKFYAEPGWTDLVWVFDIEGETLVIDACYGPDATPEQVAELVRMVQTATFVDP